MILENIRPISGKRAFSELAEKRMVFFSDTRHYSRAIGNGILYVLNGLLEIGLHRDLCREASPEEFARVRNLSISTGLQDKGGFRQGVSPKNLSCSQDSVENRPSDAFEKAIRDICHRYEAAEHPVDVPASKKDILAKRAARLLRLSESETGELPDITSEFSDLVSCRYAMDPEIAANIWYATRRRPTCVVFGAEHLRPDGLPAYFDADETAIAVIYRNAQNMTEDIERMSCSVLSPGYHNNLSHMYLVHENLWLGVGRRSDSASNQRRINHSGRNLPLVA